MINKVWLGAIIASIFLLTSIVYLPKTYAYPDMQTPEIVSINVDGFDSDKYAKADFMAFTNTKILYKLYSQSEIECKNFDGVEISVTPEPNGYYVVSAMSTKAMSTQLFFENQVGTSFANIQFVDKVSSVEIIAPYIINNQSLNTFSIIYNGDKRLKYSGEVNYTLKKGDEKISLVEGGNFVNKISSNQIVLDFSTIATNTPMSLSISANGIESTVNFKVQSRQKTSKFLVLNQEVGCFNGSNMVSINVQIENGTFGNFALKNDFLKINKIKFVETNGEFDTYEISVDLKEAKNVQDLIIVCDTTLGQVYNGVNLNTISNITSFEIVSNKKSYSSKENIIISAIINGSEQANADIDWYINGVKYTTAPILKFQRSEGGSISIFAKLDDKESNTISLNIAYRGAELIVWYCVFALALIVLIGLIIFKKKKKNYYISSNLIDRARKIMPRYELFLENYNRRQFKNLIYDVSVLKDDTLKNFSDTKDFAFERASRELASVLNEMKEIYKCDAQTRKEKMQTELSKISKCMVNTMQAYEEFSKNNPNEKIFVFQAKKNKKKIVDENLQINLGGDSEISKVDDKSKNSDFDNIENKQVVSNKTSKQNNAIEEISNGEKLPIETKLPVDED